METITFTDCLTQIKDTAGFANPWILKAKA